MLWILLWAALAAAAPPVDLVARGDAAWDGLDAKAAVEAWGGALVVADPGQRLSLLLKLAAGHRALGDFVAAQTWLGKADIEARAPAEKGRVAIGRGLLAQAQAQVQEAEDQLTVGFRRCQDAGDPGCAADAALNLAQVRLLRGRWGEARKAGDAALSLAQALRDPGGVAEARYVLARVDWREGRYADALVQLDQADAGFAAALDLTGLVDTALLRAWLLLDRGDTPAAVGALQGLVARPELTRDPRRRALACQALAAAFRRGGQVTEAVGALTLAVGLAGESGQKELALGLEADLLELRVGKPEEWTALAGKAQEAQLQAVLARAQLGRAHAALAAGDALGAAQSLDVARGVVQNHRLAALAWRVAFEGGRQALSAGKLEAAVGQLREAVTLLEAHRSGLAPEEAQRFAADHRGAYGALIQALIDAGRPGEAADYAAQLGADPGEALPEGDRARLAELQALVGLAERAVEQAQSGSGGNPLLDNELATLRSQLAETVDGLRTRYPAFDEAVRIDPDDLQGIQAGLDEGVLVLQPILFADRLVLLSYDRERVGAVTVEVQGAEVEAAIRRYSRLFQTVNLVDPAAAVRQADRLGAWLLDPVLGALEGKSTLVITADGPLREVPFAAIRSQGRWAIEAWEVVEVTHVGSLRHRDEAFGFKGEEVLLIGNPDGTLGEAEGEVQAIAEVFPKSQRLVGSAATLPAVLEGLGGKKIAHFATHGYLDPVEPAESFLVLAGTPGRLGYRDIPRLAEALRSVRLVVLSACESGVGVSAQGGDRPVIAAIAGLAAQFRRAGVESLIGTLWSVDDGPTKALMTRFYQHLSTKPDLSESLREAQLAVLRDPATSHPYYWGAFVLIGDWR